MTETLRVVSDDLRDLAADLKEVGAKVLLKELRAGLKDAAEPVARQVRSNAVWSSRIPQAVYVRSAFTAKKAGVSIVVNRKKAPHARPINNDGDVGTFDHPLFGQKEVKIMQQARPFFYDGVEDAVPEAAAAVEKVMDRIATAAGFR